MVLAKSFGVMTLRCTIGEVDLDLVAPTGMARGMDDREPGPQAGRLCPAFLETATNVLAFGLPDPAS